MPRIGVYICECGPNLSRVLDLETLKRAAEGGEGVARVRRVPVLCSPEGRAFLEEEVAGHGLDRVVVAGCSPKEHEAAFRGVLARAGLNPYLLQVAAIREQCAWVVRDPERATEQARRLIAGAVERVALHEALLPGEIPCCPDVVVIGAGTAGILAARTLAGKRRTVHLVERLSCVGGKVPLYEDVFPGMDCAACVVDPFLDELLHDERIRVHLLSRVERVLGYQGNFTVRIRTSARYVDPSACLGCGACEEVCPVRVPDAWNPGSAERRAISIPYPGALPNLASIDPAHCLRWRGEDCTACEKACPFEAVRYEDEDRVEEIPAGGIILATGFDLLDLGDTERYGRGCNPDVITAYDMERLVNTSGPTAGKMLRSDGAAPEHIGFVLCAGSRDPEGHLHCSEVCCRYTLKLVKKGLEKGGIRATVFHAGLYLPGRESQELYRELTGHPDVAFVQMRAPNALSIEDRSGSPAVRFRDEAGREAVRVLDMVVLAPAMVGAAANRDLAGLLHLDVGRAGFFDQGRTLLNPCGSGRDGVYVAGCAAGPVDIPGAAIQGQAAAGRARAELVPGETLRIHPVIARVNADHCSRCRVCETLCPYGAVEWQEAESGVAVNRLLCRGCGTCAAGCPSGAIQCLHYEDDQIRAEVQAVLRDGC